MSDAVAPLALPVRTVGDLLKVPTQTVNSWRNEGFLSNLGTKGKGRTGARLYSFGDVFVLAIMRHLTAGPMALSVPMAANLARSSRTMLVEELAGFAPGGRVMVLEMIGAVVPQMTIERSELGAHVTSWANRDPDSFTRIELFDVRRVAVDALEKVLRLPGQALDGSTDDEAHAVAVAEFEKHARALLGDEIAQFKGERRS